MKTAWLQSAPARGVTSNQSFESICVDRFTTVINPAGETQMAPGRITQS